LRLLEFVGIVEIVGICWTEVVRLVEIVGICWTEVVGAEVVGLRLLG
jgi:hypothetical protein